MPRRRKAPQFLLLILAAAAGCAGSPQKNLPEFAAVPGDEQLGSQPAASIPPVAGNPEEQTSPKTIGLKSYRFGLEQAIRWALLNNLSLMNATDRVLRAKFNIRAAASDFEVKVIPKVNASLSGGSGGAGTSRGAGLGFTKKTGIGTQLSISGDTSKTADAYTTGVEFGLEQPLLSGFGREVTQDALLDAKFGMLSSERSFIESQESLIVSVIRGFYEIIRQREVLALNEKSAERTRKHLQAAEARERVGLASRIDVLRAKIQLRQAEDNLIAAREAFGDAQDRLRILLGFGPQDDVEIDSDLSYKEFAIGVERGIGLAMMNRLDLARALDQIAETERNLRIAKNQTLPQLDLVFGYRMIGAGPSFSDSSSLSDSTWTVGLATSTDIRRTAERTRYEQIKLDVLAVKRNYQLLKDTVVREVKDAIRSLEKNRKRIDIQKADINHAQQKLKLARIKFDRGLADNFELIDAEEEIIRAETNYISAVTDYIISQAELKRAVGTLIKRPPHLLR